MFESLSSFYFLKKFCCSGKSNFEKFEFDLVQKWQFFTMLNGFLFLFHV